MATLKEHQATMVQLLANGSAIPASAARLAHAMHDVIDVLASGRISTPSLEKLMLNDATTPGLNDRALAEDIKAVRPKQVSAEQRVKQLENTIRQLKANNAKLRAELKEYTDIDLGYCEGKHYEKALDVGVPYAELGMKYTELVKILAFYGVDDPEKARAEYLKYNGQPEQSGARKPDTDWSQCQHDYIYHETISARRCLHCGDVQK